MIRFYPFLALLGAGLVLVGAYMMRHNQPGGAVAMLVGIVALYASITDQDPPLGV